MSKTQANSSPARETEDSSQRPVLRLTKKQKKQVYVINDVYNQHLVRTGGRPSSETRITPREIISSMTQGKALEYYNQDVLSEHLLEEPEAESTGEGDLYPDMQITGAKELPRKKMIK